MTRVFGQSDDLVEFEGEINDEMGAYGDDGRTLEFSDGTVLHVVYATSGIWKITVKVKGSLFENIVECEDPEADPYSDIACFKKGLMWVRKPSENEDSREDSRILAKGYKFIQCAHCRGTGHDVKKK